MAHAQQIRSIILYNHESMWIVNQKFSEKNYRARVTQLITWNWWFSQKSGQLAHSPPDHAQGVFLFKVPDTQKSHWAGWAELKHNSWFPGTGLPVEVKRTVARIPRQLTATFWRYRSLSWILCNPTSTSVRHSDWRRTTPYVHTPSRVTSQAN